MINGELIQIASEMDQPNEQYSTKGRICLQPRLWEAAMEKFNPNRLSFEEGLERIRGVSLNLYSGGVHRIVTSRDEGMADVTRQLRTDNVPDGFKKWQLPVALEGPSQFFMSFAAPDLDVPEHSHDEGDGLRVILSGSITFEGRELGPGDWMFIPKGSPYKFTVGDKGAGMFYCYRCCCA